MSSVICLKCGASNSEFNPECSSCGARLAESPTWSSVGEPSADAPPSAAGQALRVRVPQLGKYQVLEELGAGGMAVVYKARDTVLGRIVALKLMNQRLEGGETARRRFLHEARVAGALTHSNIVVIHELGVEQGTPFIAMEYLPGWDLREIIASNAHLGLGHKLGIALQVAKALGHAHSRGVIHRDVKPANIRISTDGTVKLLDFGIAKLSSESISSLTRTGGVVGSVAYMSPEQVRGESLTPTSDVFSFGIVLQELLSGGRVFHATNPATVVYRILYEEPPPLEAGSVPDELADLVRRCLRKEPAERVASFEAVGESLSSILEAVTNELGKPPPLAAYLLETVAFRTTRDPSDSSEAESDAATLSSERIVRSTDRSQVAHIRDLADETAPVIRARPLDARPRRVFSIVSALGILASGLGLLVWMDWIPGQPTNPAGMEVTGASAASTPHAVRRDDPTRAAPVLAVDRSVGPPTSSPTSTSIPTATSASTKAASKSTATRIATPTRFPVHPPSPVPAVDAVGAPSPVPSLIPSAVLVNGLRLGGSDEDTLICVDGRPWQAQRVALASILNSVPAGMRVFKLVDGQRGTAEKRFEVLAEGGSKVVRFNTDDWRPPTFRVRLAASERSTGLVLERRTRTAEGAGSWLKYDPPRPLRRPEVGFLELVGAVGEEYRVEVEPRTIVVLGLEPDKGSPEVAELRHEAGPGLVFSTRCLRPAQQACEDLPPFFCGVLK